MLLAVADRRRPGACCAAPAAHVAAPRLAVARRRRRETAVFDARRKSRAATSTGFGSPGPSTPATRGPIARRSSATPSSSAARCTPPRRSSRCSRSTPRPARSAGSSIRSPRIPKARADRASTAASSTGRTPDGRDARILVAAGARLFALDAATGGLIEGFGVERRRRSARRSRTRREQADGPRHHARLDLSRSAHSRLDGQRRPGAGGAGRRARVRRPHRQDPLELSHHSASGRVRLRHLAARCVDAHRRRQLVERVERRRAARPGVRAHRIGGVRLLGRQSARRQPVRELAARAEGRDRRARLALPVRAPRHLGSRPAAVAGAGDAAARRPQRRRGGAGHQERLRLRLRSRDRHAALPDRGAALPRIRRRGRADVADATAAGQAGAVRASDADRGGPDDDLA